jgi:hypothetical protein
MKLNIPRPADLIPSDFFFLWGPLKEEVYMNKPCTVNNLKENNCQQIAATLYVFANFEHCV